jgi:hypothetical protein
VESVSRAIDYRLEWFKNNRSTIFGEVSNNLNINNDDVEVADDENVFLNNEMDRERDVMNSSNSTYLAESFFGSPRHLKKLAINALAIVSELGPPTFFITVTTDTRWEEIQEMLLPGQTAFDRPDIVCIVFKARLQALIHNLRTGKYFEKGIVQYIMYVIEYQHRGLPHAHIVVRLNNHPENEEEIAKLRFISKHIQARYPNALPLNSSAAEKVLYDKYVDLITSKMLHKCSTQAPNGCKKDIDARCRHGYSETVQNESDSFDEKGYPVYFRPNEDDLMVVPHNKELLLDWNGHCNVEFCGKTYAVLYLYNYLFKGNQKVHFDLANADDVDKSDEIKVHLRARMLCSMDACWRILGYQTYPSSKPTVLTIKVKSEQDVIDLRNDGKLCDLAVYFDRPDIYQFKNLKFTEFFKTWDYSYTRPARYKNIIANLNPDGNLFSTNRFLKPNLYIFKRLKPEDNIVRMGMLYISAGEMWYLRLLL